MLEKEKKQQNKVTFEAEENSVYAFVKGEMVKIECPPSGFGKQEITWQNGKVTNYEVKCSYKI